MASITIWSRIEARCRANDLRPGLEARLHDPLWLLARQWQLGEFEGRDAGSPVAVDVRATAAPFDRCASGTEAGVPYDPRVPIEALIEREVARPARAAADLRQAAEAGLHFLRLLNQARVPHLRVLYLTRYPLAAVPIMAGPARRLGAVLGRCAIDGVALYADLVAAGDHLPPAPAIPPEDSQAALGVARAWSAWYRSLFSEPTGTDSWSPDRMEYRFAAGVAGDTGCFVAREYDGGAVDWHTFDRSTTALTGGTGSPTTITRRAMPAPIAFRGMPARRFWEIEDASVDLGALSAGAEDLGRLLLRELALIYGSDWFQIALSVPMGAAVGIDSFVVTDTFGQRTAVPHYADADGTAGRWHMFSISPDRAVPKATTARRLIVPPSSVATLDGVAIEDVLLLRDELADLVWGVERTVVGLDGQPLDRTLAWHTGMPPAPPPQANSMPRYQLGSSVPDAWIPFLPVTEPNGGTHLRMRRGIIPTSSGGPLGRLLAAPGLTIFLDELPREGVRLQRRYRLARGPDGSTFVWIGRCRSTGRGEGRSGLLFDYLA